MKQADAHFSTFIRHWTEIVLVKDCIFYFFFICTVDEKSITRRFGAKQLPASTVHPAPDSGGPESRCNFTDDRISNAREIKTVLLLFVLAAHSRDDPATGNNGSELRHQRNRRAHAVSFIGSARLSRVVCYSFRILKKKKTVLLLCTLFCFKYKQSSLSAYQQQYIYRRSSSHATSYSSRPGLQSFAGFTSS